MLQTRSDEAEVAELVERLRQEANETKEEEVDYALRRLDLSPEEERILRSTADSIVERLLEPPTERIQKAIEESEGDEKEMVRAAESLFGMDD